MRKLKVFISSVQNEFAEERQMLFDYLMQDALLGLFFEPFIFEKVPASDQRADNLYLEGYIERIGTGTRDIIRLCKERELKEPDFFQEGVKN